MKPNVFLISGKKFHGKDTVARMMINEMVERGYIGGARVQSFAKPLKEAAKSIFLLSQDQCYHPQYKEVVDDRWGMTPREIMQKLGTEVGRQIHQDVWVLNAIYNAKEYLAAHHGHAVFIPDTRFPNEVRIPRERLGDQVCAIRVVRPGLPASEFDNHPSETSLDGFQDWDHVVLNDGNEMDLRKRVNKLVRLIFQETSVNG